MQVWWVVHLFAWKWNVWWLGWKWDSRAGLVKCWELQGCLIWPATGLLAITPYSIASYELLRWLCILAGWIIYQSALGQGICYAPCNWLLTNSYLSNWRQHSWETHVGRTLPGQVIGNIRYHCGLVLAFATNLPILRAYEDGTCDYAVFYPVLGISIICMTRTVTPDKSPSESRIYSGVHWLSHFPVVRYSSQSPSGLHWFFRPETL